MEGFGAHYVVILHRPELRQAAVEAHTEHISAPRFRWPWRMAIGSLNETAAHLGRLAADLRDQGPASEQFVWP
jgi:hypothetical protein